MTFKTLIFSAAVGLLSASTTLAATVDVYKDAGCSCCGGWIAHMQTSGFLVAATNIGYEEMDALKEKAGIGTDLFSCHTAMVEGYAIEGHVPADDIKRLLAERPDAIGLAVPGMPGGAPGMESAAAEPYDVLLILKDGSTQVFASH